MAAPLSIDRTGPVAGRVRVPGSKSMTNRALVAAALASGTSRLTGGLAGDDSASMVDGLRRLGASVRDIRDIRDIRSDLPAWEVVGTAGVIAPGPLIVDADLAGTTLRFLTAVAALGDGGITVTGRGGLLRRPVGRFLDALRACGADVAGSGVDGNHAPVRVGRRLRPLGGVVAVDATESSQFVTALLLVAPYFEQPLDLEVSGLGASGFVDLTIEVMARFGVEVEQLDDHRFSVPAGTGYRAVEYAVPPDASAASHLVTLAATTGGEVVVESLDEAASQPDYGFLAVAERFGVEVAHGGDGAVTAHGPERLSPVDVDLRAMPDQLPNVAVLAALASGTSRISGVGITRHHESDRMAVVAGELGKVGVAVDLGDDDVIVHGGAQGGAVLSSHGDHRMAMAFTALAAALGDCAIAEPEAVTKTYQDFWSDVRSLGLGVSSLA